jgi:hypothetical protein
VFLQSDRRHRVTDDERDEVIRDQFKYDSYQKKRIEMLQKRVKITPYNCVLNTNKRAEDAKLFDWEEGRKVVILCNQNKKGS